MKTGSVLLMLSAVLVIGAGDAHALRAYVPETADACRSCGHCAQSASSAKIGAFQLDGVATDKAHGSGCGVGSGCGQHGFWGYDPANCPILGAAGLVVNPVAAVLNDAHLLITMPYRKAEPLN